MDRLPGIEMYKRLYNDDHELDKALQARIARVYEGFMAFCIKASEYYVKGGSHRWLQAFLGLSSIQDEADNVERLVVEMRILCEDLLAKSIDQIKQLSLKHHRELEEQLELIRKESAEQTKELRKKNAEQAELILKLNAEIVGHRASKDDDNAREIQRLLNQETFSEKELDHCLKQHRDILETNIHYHGSLFKQMQGETLDLFKADKIHQTWLRAHHASLLILVGVNNQGAGICHDDCWLSPLAFATIDEHKAKNSTLAYFVFPSKEELLFHAMSSIFVQLLRKRCEVLRTTERYNQLRTDLLKFNNLEKNQTSSRADKVAKLKAFQNVAACVIGLFNEEDEVVIVIDRADRCGRLREGEDQRKAFLKVLVKMTHEARCKLKILVILDGIRWPLEDHKDELEISKRERVIIHTIRQELIQ